MQLNVYCEIRKGFLLFLFYFVFSKSVTLQNRLECKARKRAPLFLLHISKEKIDAYGVKAFGKSN